MKIKDDVLLVIGGALVLLLTIGAFIKEHTAEWKSHQSNFMELAQKKLGAKQAESFDMGIHQIWVPQLKVVDRCKTCHMAIDVPGFEKEKQPFSTHPKLRFFNKTHPFRDYGCTSCHGGQGYATRSKDAHGEVHHWEKPMFTKKTAVKYGFKKADPLMEVNCNVCHRHDPSTQLMPSMNLAKKLIKDKNCRSCHVIKGRGGNIGPELTYEGGKHAEAFVFSNVKGAKTVLNWHVEHFVNPAKISKDSTMTNFGFTKKEATVLGLLVMSWRKASIPVEYVPNPLRKQRDIKDIIKVEPVKKVAGTEAGKAIFTSKCVACHSFGKGKRIGPDLKGVSKRRTAAWITKFLKDTPGMLAKDPTAKKLLKQYKIPMPPQGLDEVDIKNMIQFFKDAESGKIKP